MNSSKHLAISGYLVVLAFACIFIIASGCTSNQATPTYYTGTTGIHLEFYSGNSKEALENDAFSLGMSLKNLGTYSLTRDNKGVLTINYDDYYLELDQKFASGYPIVLHAKDVTYPLGDEDTLEVNFKTKQVNKMSDFITTKIGFNICYPYKTEASIITCIDTKFGVQADNAQACKSTTYTNIEGQGAPLSISQIVPEMKIINEKDLVLPQFKIYITNKGKGKVMKSTPNTCGSNDARLAIDGMNNVTVSAILSGKPMICEPSEIKLKDNAENFVRCSVSPDSTEFKRTKKNYVAPLTVKLDYVYLDSETYTMQIKSNKDVTVVVPKCGVLEKEDNGKCISLCTYCISNPTAAECQKGIPTQNFAYTKDFGCYCDSNQCSGLAKEGKCIFGKCSGGTECCATNECDNAQDGVSCGDNLVCKDHKCTSTTGCEWLAQQTKENFTCRSKETCDSLYTQDSLCPSEVERSVKCCLENPCYNKADGTGCKDNYVCIGAACDTSSSVCDFRYASQGYSCLYSGACANNTIKNEKGLCPLENAMATSCCKSSVS